MYKRYSYVPDREGAGKFRGSYPILREWEFLGEEGTLQMRTERQRSQPWGLQGGESGAFSETILKRGGEEYKMHKETVTIRKGDSVCIMTSGGGGWGSPLEDVYKRQRWDKILVFECKAAPELSQRSIGEISAGRGVEPLDAIYDILLTEIKRIHEVMVVELIYDESDLQLPFEHADCMVGSDATALATDGPLQGRCFHGAYTWAAWFFRHYTRETKSLAPESAIRRLTSLPAERFGIKDRGILRKGAWADVAIFDPLRFGERGTIFAPNQVAEGMMHVLVNGTVTLKDGQFTGERNGQVIRR